MCHDPGETRLRGEKIMNNSLGIDREADLSSDDNSTLFELSESSSQTSTTSEKLEWGENKGKASTSTPQEPSACTQSGNKARDDGDKVSHACAMGSSRRRRSQQQPVTRSRRRSGRRASDQGTVSEACPSQRADSCVSPLSPQRLPDTSWSPTNNTPGKAHCEGNHLIFVGQKSSHSHADVPLPDAPVIVEPPLDVISAMLPLLPSYPRDRAEVRVWVHSVLLIRNVALTTPPYVRVSLHPGACSVTRTSLPSSGSIVPPAYPKIVATRNNEGTFARLASSTAAGYRFGKAGVGERLVLPLAGGGLAKGLGRMHGAHVPSIRDCFGKIDWAMRYIFATATA